MLYLFAISSLGVYGIIIAGWASNSKYAFLGALRSAAQMVSYEIAMGFVLVSVLLMRRLAQPLRHRAGAAAGWFWNWFWLPLLPMFVVFFVSALAETNRAPFDLAEGGSRARRRLHVEYSAMTFALFFLAEYANMILMCGDRPRCCSSAAGCRRSTSRRSPGCPGVALVRSARSCFVLFVFLLGPRHVAALPLRPDDAAGLEGVPARLAGLARARRPAVLAVRRLGSDAEENRTHGLSRPHRPQPSCSPSW